MSFDHLWAGWRSSYVEGYDEPPNGSTASGAGTNDGATAAGDDARSGASERVRPPCPFCAVVESDAPDEERLVVSSGPSVVVILNLYPYASGHVLVMPARHVGELDELTAEESGELWAALRSAVGAQKRAYSPDGCNIGANLGHAAGAGIPAHLHLHAVPRWLGDTNFMTTTASVRVLPEALDVSWRKLRAAWR